MTHYDQFIKDTWAVAGIYTIRNKVNSKFYLGEGKNVGRRVCGQIERLFANNHPVKSFQKDFNALGVDAFYFELLQEEGDDDIRITLETSLQEKHKELLYSSFINGGLTRECPITAEQRDYITSLREGGLSWAKIAKAANAAFGYDYSFGWYQWLLTKRKAR